MTNWALIPVLNCLDYTKQAVEDLRSQDIPVSIAIVDNGSTDGTSEWAAKSVDVLLSFDENQGVARAWNLGLKLLFEALGAEHVLVCNNDIRLRPETYRALLIPENAGFITPINVTTMERMLRHEGLPEKDPIMRGGPDFSCFLIKKDFYYELGEFDEGFERAYYEDGDYDRRAFCKWGEHGRRDHIYSVAYPYVHFGSATIKNNPEVARLNDVSFQKNRQRYIEKWGGLPGDEKYITPFNS